MKSKVKYPATVVAHWATGPEPCCDRHAGSIVALGNMMGFHVAITIAEEGDECNNCINEETQNE